jgi:NADP-dependent 3-hydroxy acid dehydrogenase YdfG
MDNYKVLCTGNPSKPGIANAVFKVFPNATFLSLSTGHNLLTEEGQLKFRTMIKDYNVFVNISQLSNNTQEKLLKIAYEEGMKGNIFNIGSIAEYKRWEWYNHNYTTEKRQLKETSLDLCSEFFKTTHITVGGFQDSSNSDLSRMNPEEIAKAILFILESKVNIPVIGIEKINDDEMKEQLARRNK